MTFSLTPLNLNLHHPFNSMTAMSLLTSSEGLCIVTQLIQNLGGANLNCALACELYILHWTGWQVTFKSNKLCVNLRSVHLRLPKLLEFSILTLNQNKLISLAQ